MADLLKILNLLTSCLKVASPSSTKRRRRARQMPAGERKWLLHAGFPFKV